MFRLVSKAKLHGPREDKRFGRTPPNSLGESERAQVLEILSSDEFVDETPYQVVSKMLDRGEWICSIRTMYRILAADNQVKERRQIARRVKYTKPVLKATGPNQVWTWDITRLPGPWKGMYYLLYVMLDIFSRYVVGWMVAREENSMMAQHFVRETVNANAVTADELTIHSDRGSPMKAADTVALLATLGLVKALLAQGQATITLILRLNLRH